MPKDPEQTHSTIVEKGGTGGRHNVNWEGEKYRGNGQGKGLEDDMLL